MAVTPTGSEGVPLVKVRALISQSAAFQTWTSSGSAGAALAHIHYVGLDNPAAVTHPFAIVGYSQEDGHDRAKVGSPRAFDDDGSVVVAFVAEVHSEAATIADQVVMFANNTGAIWTEVVALTGVGDALNIEKITRQFGPLLSSSDEEADDPTHLESHFRVQYGVAE